MLRDLTIQNIAIAEHVDVEFAMGLNVITGETGAGKSILVEALSLLRGSKADASLIRTGCENACITGVFEVKPNGRVRKLLEESGIEFDPKKSEIVLRKSLSRNGKHKTYINDVMVQSRTLQTVAAELIDISSQFENQRLLDEASHTSFLDHFVRMTAIAETLAEKFKASAEFVKQISQLDDAITKQKRELALYQYELQEIENANLDAKEWDEIQSLLRLGGKATQAQKTCGDILGVLNESESSCTAQLQFVLKQAEKLQKIAGNSLLPLTVDACREALAILEGLSFNAERTAGMFDIDEEKLAQANLRVEIYNRLLSKFGPSLEDIELYRQRCAAFLNENSSLEEQRERVLDLTNQMMIECVDLAKKLSKKRSEGVAQIARAVEAELAELGMPKTRFVCRLEATQTDKDVGTTKFLEGPVSKEVLESFSKMTKTGFERAHFLMSANVGIDPQPIEKIASGGELSRVMLAIKNVLFSDAALSVFVFDEIDTGVSGPIASKIGKKLSEFCKGRQSICITHLPQVACFAHEHFIATKKVVNQKTTASLVRANATERITELAKMMSGEKVTPESLAQAKRLVSEVQKNA